MKMRLLWLLAAALQGAALAPLRAQDRILDYHSDVIVRRDATLSVSETIKVDVTGRGTIRHGIYRDFPTRYTGRLGNRIHIRFDLQSVLLDGLPAKHSTENLSNGIRIKIGDANRYVAAGEHRYELAYTVNRELGFFKNYDEVYWNVTGNGWDFPIDRASATVTLPKVLSRADVGVDAYTGSQGAKGKDFRSTMDASGRVQFETTRSLGSREGLTIAVAFPKGLVVPPSRNAAIADFFADNRAVLVGLILLLAVFAYFLLTWYRYGRDIPAGTIIPLYTPPEGFSPAALRYVRKMGYDHKAFAAALIDLAVKGQVTISEESLGLFGGQRAYTVARAGAHSDAGPQAPPAVTEIGRRLGISSTVVNQAFSSVAGLNPAAADAAGTPADAPAPAAPQTPAGPALTDDESVLLESLLPGPADVLLLSNSAYREIQQAISSFRSALRSQCEGRYFVTNVGAYLPGVLLSILALVIVGFMSFSGLGEEDTGKLIGSVMFTGMPVLFFFLGGIPLWRAVFTGGAVSRAMALVRALFLTGFLAVFFVIGAVVIKGLPVALLLLLAAFLALDAIFYHLMKAPTTAGRKLLDAIEGFRMYLDTAEKDDLNLANPPERTPELFERYLPYALALDVEQRWAECFAGVLARAGTEDGRPYHPAWYYGNSWGTLGAAGFASSLGSDFSSAISSSSTAPGSSSGSSGGGSSGGGGGGGGGGGW